MDLAILFLFVLVMVAMPLLWNTYRRDESRVPVRIERPRITRRRR
jgi:hypothetical protein